MGDKKIFLIAKAFNEKGCLAYQCKSIKEAKYIPGSLDLLRQKDVQIVLLDNPDIYSEYAPYNYIENLTDFVEKVISLNKAA